MNTENVQRLLGMLGCVKIRPHMNGWIHASCPLAPWKHSGGRDAKPSFAVAASIEGFSNYKCLSCQAKGDLRTLVYKLEILSGANLAAAMDFVQQYDQPSVNTLKKKIETSTYWGSAATEIGGVKVSNAPFFLLHPEDGLPLETPLEESELDAFTADLPEDVLAHLTRPKGDGGRGLTMDSIKEWEIRWHTKGRRIGIPVRDVKGRLMSISGRAFFAWQKPKFMHTKGFKRDLYLYGENRVQKGGLGILVEGFFDVVRIRQAGFPLAVACMGSYLSTIQVEKLSQFFNHVLIIPDGDKAGSDAAKGWVEALKGRVPTSVMAVEEGSDPDDLEAPQIAFEVNKYQPA